MISNAEEAEISDLVNHEMQHYETFISNNRPYCFLDYLQRKYNYPVGGETYYDLLHDHYNKTHLDKVQPVREVASFRDFTYSIIKWFYTANDVYTAIDPKGN